MVRSRLIVAAQILKEKSAALEILMIYSYVNINNESFSTTNGSYYIEGSLSLSAVVCECGGGGILFCYSKFHYAVLKFDSSNTMSCQIDYAVV